MYETLFKRPTILARYREGPLSEAREKYIEQCAARGYSLSMLKKIAWVLLAVAHGINIDRGAVTVRDIQQAVDGRTRFKRMPEHAQDSSSYRQLFVGIATKWLQSLGYLVSFQEDEYPFSAQVDIFAHYLLEERGLSPVTVSTRCERLAWFFKSLNPPRDSLHAISVNDIDTFIETKGKQGWKRSSLASLTSSLRSFFRYAEGQAWCSKGIAAIIESPRLYVREGLPKGPSWEIVQQLLDNTRSDYPADIRAHAILILLAVYGLRRGEVASLTLDDIDWVGEQLTVRRPKQRHTQCYPLLPAFAEAIVRYLRDVRPDCQHRALFLTLSAPIRPLSAASITPIVNQRLRTQGVSSAPRGPHCLRHACAEHLLASGFSLKQIGDHLGHQTVNSTLYYTKVDLPGLRQVADLDLGELL